MDVWVLTIKYYWPDDRETFQIELFSNLASAELYCIQNGYKPRGEFEWAEKNSVITIKKRVLRQ